MSQNGTPTLPLQTSDWLFNNGLERCAKRLAAIDRTYDLSAKVAMNHQIC